LTYDHIKEIPYIEGLIKEALRIYPPVVLLSRLTGTETMVNDIKVPPGTGVFLDLISMGHNSKIWGPDVKLVRPERWFSENLTKEQRVASLPFSSGARVCIGLNLSLLEQKIFLVKLLRCFKKISLAPNGEFKPRLTSSVTYSPDMKALRIQFESF